MIDGGSTDGTLSETESLGLTVLHQASRGKGSAVREALEWVGAQGIPFALLMDADCTYPPEMIGPSLALLKAGGQLVVGVRNPVHAQQVGARDIVHRVGNTLLNWLATQSTGQPILDLCSGFYALDLRTGVHLNLSATGFEIESEMFLKAYRTGLRVLQIPIAYRERVGNAKLRAVQDGGRIFISILRSRRIPLAGVLDPVAGPGPLMRELLSACFVHGSRELVVLAHPSRVPEANALVSRLVESRFGHARVVPEPEEPGGSQLTPDLDVPVGHAWPGAAVLRLGPKSGGVRMPVAPDAMFLPSMRRLIRLDLEKADLSGGAGAADGVPGAARSGARRLPSRSARYLGSLTAIGSTLDSTGFDKEMILHSANGLRGVAFRTGFPLGNPPARAFLADEDRSTGRPVS